MQNMTNAVRTAIGSVAGLTMIIVASVDFPKAVADNADDLLKARRACMLDRSSNPYHRGADPALLSMFNVACNQADRGFLAYTKARASAKAAYQTYATQKSDAGEVAMPLDKWVVYNFPASSSARSQALGAASQAEQICVKLYGPTC